jgi:hypothetical protein
MQLFRRISPVTAMSTQIARSPAPIQPPTGRKLLDQARDKARLADFLLPTETRSMRRI